MYRPTVLFLFGSCLGLYGFQALRDQQTVSPVPVKQDLHRLERRDLPANAHIEFGEHVRLYDFVVVSFDEPETGMRGNRPPPHANVRYCYIPAMSPQSQAALKKKQKQAKVTGRPVFVDQLALIIKSTDYREYGDVPQQPKTQDSVQGMLIGTLADLPAEERAEITKNFKCKFPDRVWVLAENQQPAPSAVPKVSLMIGVGMLLLGFVWGWRKMQIA